MGVKEWFAKRDDADTTWTRNFTADATFEQWLGQVGTDFLPPDTSSYPDPAQWTPTLRDAFVSGDFGSYAWMYKNQPSVYTVVEFLAWQVSQCSVKSYDRVGDGDRRHLTNSEVEQTISNPAPGLTYARMMHGTVADLGVYGNAYWALMDATDGLPFDGYVIVPICAEFMRPLGGNVLEAAEYEWEMGGTKHRLPAEKVCHFRRYNPTDRRIGISPLQPLKGILTEDFESTRYREVLWKRSARIGGFIRRNPEKAGAPMDPESREHFRAGLDKFTRGGNREAQWMLLEDGEIPVPMAFSPRDAEFIEGRRLGLETVARAYNIPLPVLSLTEHAAYNSSVQYHQALYQDTLPPWTRLIEDEVDAKVVPWIRGTSDTNEYVEFNLEEKMRGAFEEQASLLLQAGGGPYMTRNEIRARLNLPRVDDPDADKLVLTNNMVGTESDQPNPQQQPVPASVTPLPQRQQGGTQP